jgi:hypothetical protein
MATIGQLGEVVTTQLRRRIDRLVSAVEDDGADLAEVSRLAGTVGELARAVGDAYEELDQLLLRGLHAGLESENEPNTNGRRPEQRQERSGEKESAGADVTKEELLERAREVNVAGRSSMSKEELAEAVEAEEAVTKEELLERAREADIEGRSSMAKDELRKALNDANA